MRKFQNILHAFKYALKEPISEKGYTEGYNSRNEYFRELYAYGSPLDRWTDFQTEELRKQYHKALTSNQSGESVVYSIISRIAGAMGEMAGYMELLDKNGKIAKGKETDVVWNRLNNPNDIDTFTSFIQLIGYNLLSVGDAFVYGEWVEQRGRGEMYVMPSHQVQIVRGGIMQPIKGYKLTNSAYKSELGLTKDNTLLIKLPNPDIDSLYGLSPLCTLLKDLDVLNSAKKREKKLIDEGGVRNIITPKEKPDGNIREYIDILKRDMNKNDAKTNDVRAIPMEVTRLGDTATDLALQQVINSKTESVCNAYNFPINLLRGDSTFNNLSGAKKQVYTVSMPYVTMVFDALGKFLKIDKYGYKFKLNTDLIEELKPDNTAVINAMRGITTVDEMRTTLGFPEIGGELGKTIFMGVGQAPANDLIIGSGTNES